ncbi:hypothetical protein ZIOFF_067040 [Zingiber officinale]|uniref:Uncharacterized protein n=2 Tax=Zingiber officinale TaxID=94328 RepID=A0A8J5EUJ3_ZINOF|nr:hypothetical protein ZIOFF_067040 [Zingiber officinale]
MICGPWAHFSSEPKSVLRLGRDGGAWVVADAGGISTPRFSLVWLLRHLGAAHGGVLEDRKYFLSSLLYFPPTSVRSVSDALLPMGFLCYAPFPVLTDVHGRTFGVWTLLTCTLCFLCAFNLENKPLYAATFLSFIYAFGHFLTEYLFYDTMAASNLTTVGIFAGSYREGKGKREELLRSLISVLMAATCARSPSPNPSRPRTPDMAISRKSCSSIPSSFTESSPLRNHCCRSPSPTPRASAHKENERDFNRASRPMATKAVSSSSSKSGGKNFMSPTISAASKAVTASPRRKILAEKNEAAVASSVRSSLSSLPDESPVIMEEAPAEREVGAGPLLNQNLWEAGDSSEICSEQEDVELEVKNHRVSGALSSPCSFSRSTSTTTAAIASLDADPILPPYDPHTNYLSPRPQFLHYRPNPRIEQYWLDESGLIEVGDGKRLEDSFSSESCDNSEEQNEEETSSNLQKECEDVPAASDEEDIAAIRASESESKIKSSGVGRSFLKYTFASCLLVSVIACLLGSFGGYPVLSPTVLKLPTSRQAIDHLHMSEYISAVNLAEVCRRLGLWSFEAVAYRTRVNAMPRQEFGPIFLANFTSSNLEQRLDIIHSGTVPSNELISEETGKGQPFSVPLDYRTESSEMEQTYLKVDVPLEDEAVSNEVDTPFDGAMEILELDVPLGEPWDETLAGHESGDAIYLAKDLDENDDTLEAETGPELHQDMEKSSLSEFESLEKTVQDDSNKMEVRGVDDEYEHVVEVKQPRNGQDNPPVSAIEHEAAESQVDSASVFSASQTQCSIAEETPLASNDEGIPSIHELHALSAYTNDGKVAIGLCLAILLLVASIMFFIMKQKKPTPSVNELEVPKEKEVLSKSASGSSESYGHARGSPYENTPVDTLLAESGPLEFSSSLRQSTSIQHRTTSKNNEEETLSHEKRRLRRDSTVSSSSMSYGSFTSYEKFSAKKKGIRDDDEVVTPVRRSSRIRNQIASP